MRSPHLIHQDARLIPLAWATPADGTCLEVVMESVRQLATLSQVWICISRLRKNCSVSCGKAGPISKGTRMREKPIRLRKRRLTSQYPKDRKSVV